MTRGRKSLHIAHDESQSCESCYFYVGGYCQRFPPVVIKDDGKLQGHWPGVGKDDWCGEWRIA